MIRPHPAAALDLGRDGRRPDRRLIALLAATSAVTAANVYLNQPLLGAVAASLGVGRDTLGAVPTATQLGYAAGILLLVPAGDGHDRRRLILGLGTASAFALAACALSPSAWFLIVSSFAVGLLSPVPQLVTPLAVALAGGDTGRDTAGDTAGDTGGDKGDGGRARGRIVGVVQGGLLVGVLASRAYSGAFAEVAGWRAVYGCSCALTLVLVIVLRRALPHVPAAARISYRATLASLPKLFVSRPLIRRITISGALVGIAFGAFWTTLTFLLERQYHFGSSTIGLFGLVAAASALASPYAGRMTERLGRRRALAVLIGLVIAGWLILLPGATGLWWLIAGVLVLDVGVWGSQAVCQTVLFTLDPATHNRLNTVYFTLRFLGIALGSLLGSLAWAGGAWPAVVTTGVVAALAGLLVCLLPTTGWTAAPSASSSNPAEAHAAQSPSTV
ncbi:MFS transporter [Planotetraspora kaengkrachanensis]|uniref:MFS transporter n=1 Tax=Planotetraspora kaengkrachanensis TaxID=575193 RepID=UPI001EF248A5|nr:MFS transporter [Planotetraspora kaengkrachanensis]